MLGKLLKYDIKFGARAFLGMAAVLLLLGLLGPYLIEDATQFATALVVIPIAVACVILIVQAYNKSLFSGQGYFTLTLPVKPGALIFSKALIAVFWFNVILVSTVVGVVLLVRDLGLFSSLITNFWDSFFRWLEINLSALMAILSIYTGVALGNVSVKNRRLGWIGYTVGIAVPLVAQGLISSQLMPALVDSRYLIVTDKQTLIGSSEKIMELYRTAEKLGSIDWTNLVVSAVMFAACYCTTVWLIKRKVDLQ